MTQKELEDQNIVNLNISKQPSEELIKLLAALKKNVSFSKDIFETIVIKAKEEGFNDKEIDILIYSTLKGLIPKSSLLRYRKEFIPLGINTRNNHTEESSSRSGPFGPDNETKLGWKNVTGEVMEKLRHPVVSEPTETESTETPTERLSDLAIKETNKQIQQFKAKINLVVKNHNRFKNDPEIEEMLIKKVTDPSISVDNAKIIIAQKASDLETGAIVKVDNSYIFDYTKREKIEKHLERSKQPLEYFLLFQKTFEEIMYSLMGYRIDPNNENEIFYEPKHIESTEKHRIDMIKELNLGEMKILENNIDIAKEILTSLSSILDVEITNKERNRQ